MALAREAALEAKRNVPTMPIAFLDLLGLNLVGND